MKKKCVRLALGVLIVLFTTQPLLATIQVDDPSYSQIDGLSYSDATVACENFHSSEACELFRAKEAYSLRDGISYADCSVECDELFEFDSCHVYRQSHPCEDSPLTRTVASIN
jgi:hypothetical protein